MNAILKKQRCYFRSLYTRDLTFRKEHLRRLKAVLQENENALFEAIQTDFGKSTFDTYTTELAIIYKDIDFYIKNLDRLAQPKKVHTNLANQPGSSYIISEPLGNTLVIGAWNYPYQLSIAPAVAAIAAGNTCIIKPSELPANTARVMAQLINTNFPAELLYVAEGGVEATTALLEERFDKIFFTGSPRVGRIVYEAAAKHLTPVTLELGGKSPVIVTKNANIEVAAKRIVWGKFLNAGQTCIAPDYVLVEESVEEKLIQALIEKIKAFNYTENASHYTKIINDRNTERLIGLIDSSKIAHGGGYNKERRFIEPTIMRGVSREDAIMQEEIFGPILPVLTFSQLDEALLSIRSEEKPLSAYLFSNDHHEQELFTSTISFGGGCINDVVMHIANEHLPFGGVGQSGLGSYHGEQGFRTFSHQKSMLKKATWGEPNLKYPPYSEGKLSWIKRLI
jgi:aldehyde dehydrogenase (NAD+)